MANIHIPKMIQKSVLAKLALKNFDQAEPAHKWPPIRNRGPFVRIERLGCQRSQNRFLNHFWYKTLFLSLFLLISCSTVIAQEIVGFWKTIDENTARTQSIIAIYQYMGNYYGRIIASCDKNGEVDETLYAPVGRAKNLPGQPYFCGMDIIWNLRQSGSKYKGKILDPRDGSVYNAALWRNNDNLIVRGELLFFGKNKTWHPAWNSDFPDDFVKPDLKKFIPLIPQLD